MRPDLRSITLLPLKNGWHIVVSPKAKSDVEFCARSTDDLCAVLKDIIEHSLKS